MSGSCLTGAWHRLWLSKLSVFTPFCYVVATRYVADVKGVCSTSVMRVLYEGITNVDDKHFTLQFLVLIYDYDDSNMKENITHHPNSADAIDVSRSRYGARTRRFSVLQDLGPSTLQQSTRKRSRSISEGDDGRAKRLQNKFEATLPEDAIDVFPSFICHPAPALGVMPFADEKAPNESVTRIRISAIKARHVRHFLAFCFL
jgi:hypothetical protein